MENNLQTLKKQLETEVVKKSQHVALHDIINHVVPQIALRFINENTFNDPEKAYNHISTLLNTVNRCENKLVDIKRATGVKKALTKLTEAYFYMSNKKIKNIIIDNIKTLLTTLNTDDVDIEFNNAPSKDNNMFDLFFQHFNVPNTQYKTYIMI